MTGSPRKAYSEPRAALRLAGPWGRGGWRAAMALPLAALVFLVDSGTSLPSAVAVLYAGIVLLVAEDCAPRTVLLTGLGCALLAVGSFLAMHYGEPWGASHLRLAVSLAAIAITTLLALRKGSAERILGQQAEILDLTHDTVIICDADDIIRYWNGGAEKLYGWTRHEAVGARCQDLLGTRFPVPVKEIERLLRTTGSWSGDLVRTRRDGQPVELQTRLLWRPAAGGERGDVIETSADMTERKRADASIRNAEHRYRLIFQNAGVAIWENDFSRLFAALEGLEASGVTDVRAHLLQDRALVRRLVGMVAVTDVNETAVALFQAAERGQLLGSVGSAISTPEAEETFARLVASMWDGDGRGEAETSFQTLAGERIDVLLRLTIPAEATRWERVLVTMLDVTERNRTQQALTRTLAELAHASRVSTLGQMAASIAHEVNQPLSAIVTYGEAGRRWLKREAPGAEETAACLTHMLDNGRRAAEVIERVRALSRKSVPRKERFALCEVVDASLVLVQRELATGGITLRQTMEAGLPEVLGDRIQIQQVIMNLLLNSIQALVVVDGPSRVLFIDVARSDPDMIRVAVRDRGVGIAETDLGQLFEPFFTTKSNGMGIGLSICRSIVESHGGRIWASNNGGDEGGGATVQFTLPVAREGA